MLLISTRFQRGKSSYIGTKRGSQREKRKPKISAEMEDRARSK